MIIYFISALLISTVLYKLGSYVTIVGLMVTATKVVGALTGLLVSVLLWKWYQGSKQGIKLIGRS